MSVHYHKSKYQNIYKKYKENNKIIVKPNEWKSMLNEIKDNYDLRFIIDLGPDEWKEKALVKLSKNSPSKKDIEYVISGSLLLPDKWKKRAREIFNK